MPIEVGKDVQVKNRTFGITAQLIYVIGLAVVGLAAVHMMTTVIWRATTDKYVSGIDEIVTPGIFTFEPDSVALGAMFYFFGVIIVIADFVTVIVVLMLIRDQRHDDKKTKFETHFFSMSEEMLIPIVYGGTLITALILGHQVVFIWLFINCFAA